MTDHPSQRFRTAAERKDLDGMLSALSPDVVLNSPVKHRPFATLAEIRFVLGVLIEIFDDFRYTDELHADGVAVLVFRAQLGGLDVEGVDVLRFDAAGLIDDLTVMLRPRSALEAVMEQIRVRLEASAV